MSSAIDQIISYAIQHKLISEEDETFCRNRLLDVLELDALEEIPVTKNSQLHEILEAFCSYAVSKGLIGDSVTEKDLFDTKIMGVFTPYPHEVIEKFNTLYAESSRKATDWYYQLSCDVNYIRTDRIKKDKKWSYDGKYGRLEISINLAKPEKDPRAIAAAKTAAATAYPKCQLCLENEGYHGRANHPARQNLRLIPLNLAEESYYLQYSPYVYYNEHCIVLNRAHIPMVINENTFRRLFAFVEQFPHYFLGSNADLPIVGGSILSHDHFQGGRYELPMAKAEIHTSVSFEGFDDISAGILNWPLSVIRLNAKDPERLILLASKILELWRRYSDKSAFIFSETDGEMHNTITPITRRRGENYELDLVLRNNITTLERPLGVYHPRPELHHIKKENIGLIEVMGLAILPSRLNKELDGIKSALLNDLDISQDEALSKHAVWVDKLKKEYSFTRDNVDEILQREVGKAFEQVLEDAGVFKTSDSFLKFIFAAGGHPVAQSVK